MRGPYENADRLAADRTLLWPRRRSRRSTRVRTASSASRSRSSRSRRPAPRRARTRWPAAASRRSSPTSARRCASSSPALTHGRGHRVRRLEAARHGARAHFADIVPEERARRLLHGRPARDVPVDAGPGRRACSSSGPTRRADPDRHAVARRPSGLQHAGDDAQRIARRHAGGGRDRTRAAGDAAATPRSIRRCRIATS